MPRSRPIAALPVPRRAASGPDLTLERARWSTGHPWVAATDECGRGPLSGPVMTGAIILHPDTDLSAFAGVRDSKTLTPKRIDAIADAILADAYRPAGLIAWGLGAASAREIDRRGIGVAVRIAMARAVGAAERHLRRVLGDPAAAVTFVLVDGLPLKQFPYAHEGTPKLDARSLSCSLAACLAKATRDRLMTTLGARHGFPSWATDAGYGSAAHLAALADRGPVPGVHRWSFRPVREAAEAQQARGGGAAGPVPDAEGRDRA